MVDWVGERFEPGRSRVLLWLAFSVEVVKVGKVEVRGGGTPSLQEGGFCYVEVVWSCEGVERDSGTPLVS